MTPDDLLYPALVKRLAPLSAKGRTESATFLNWFLENIYRLDDVTADDCICDEQNDLGIDGIYVNNNDEEIQFLQAKIRQNPKGTIGDVEPKTFSASVKQFSSPAKIQKILAGHGGNKLKSLIERLEVADLLGKGYSLRGLYVSNELKNKATEAYCALDPDLTIYDRAEIAANFIEPDQGVGVTGSFEFDLSYVAPLEMTIAGAANPSIVYVFPAMAKELVSMGGIADTNLFTKNVRHELGNTAVNRSIRSSIQNRREHKNFPLFHNGVIILCEEEKIGDRLVIRNYSVVNGAQSITSFHNSRSKLTDDLRVLVRVISLQDDALAR